MSYKHYVSANLMNRNFVQYMHSTAVWLNTVIYTHLLCQTILTSINSFCKGIFHNETGAWDCYEFKSMGRLKMLD